MKHILRLFLAASFIVLVQAGAVGQVTLPHYDGFDYAPSSMVGGQGGWSHINSGDTIWVGTGSLTLAGLSASTGNKITYSGAGGDLVKLFTLTNTGSVYYSYLLKVTNTSALKADGYISGFYQSSTSTTTGTLAWVKQDGAGIAIGVSARTVPNAPVNYSSTKDLNTTYFIVGSYTFVAGTTNDSAKLWIDPDPSTFGNSEPVPTLTSVNTGTDLTGVARFLFRQDQDTTTAAVELDELRIGTTWGSVTPSAASSVLEAMGGGIPQGLGLQQNYPNPFNPSTTIEFSVASTKSVTVNVHDLMGREVATLVNQSLSPGTYRVNWNAETNPSGIYFYTVRAGNETMTRRMILMK